MLVARTGQHVIGDMTLQIRVNTFLQLPMQCAEKTERRFRNQSQNIKTIHANLSDLSQNLGLNDTRGVPALVHLYEEHTKDHTAGELLAAALTTGGRLVFISNKLAATRPRGAGAINQKILTSWGGKPDAEMESEGSVRIESVYDTVKREGIEETGINIGPFVDKFQEIPCRLLTIGKGLEEISTPMPCNIRAVSAIMTKL